MGTISGNLYKVGYIILTNAAVATDPPSVVGPLTFALVNATTQVGAINALTTDLSLAGNQRLSIQEIQQVHGGLVIYN